MVAERMDAKQAKQAFSLFSKDGQVIEMRALNASLHGDHVPYDKPRVIAGWYDNPDAMIASLQQIASAEGIYITINPCEPALLARANNRLKDKKVTATTDQQIVKRQYLLLDADPERAGHVTGVPTNDEEHQLALDLVKNVCEILKSEGWPDAIRFDSGNGGYALYAIDLPADDNGLIERAHKGIAQRFDTDQVHFDQTTFNQSRIARLPGTMNCKGDGIPDERPHRMAKIIHIPDEIQPVPIELLEAIAVPVEQEQPKQEKKAADKSTSYKGNQKLPPDYLDAWNVPYGTQLPYNGGFKWQLEACPFCGNSDHNAYVYVSSGNELGFKCSHNSCTGLHWRDLRLKLEPTAYDRHEQWNGHIRTNSDEDLNSFDADDAGNGDAMNHLFGHVFIYNEAVGWMYYTGTHWQADEGHAKLIRAAIETLRRRRHAAVDAKRENIIKVTASNTQRINGAIACFKTHVLRSIDTFDAEEHLLNCKNGVVNLKTGELTPHSEKQYFTYCVPIEHKESDATEWIDYLHGVVGGGAEMIDYLQLALGYSLTGSTREECLFYVYGPSRSGKGTVAEILLRLLPRPLSTMVDFNSFTAKREGDVSNFDLAELKPSRVVFASESQRNQSLNPAKIKQLTGGDLVRASFKHKNFFTYRPQFKVWMLSNWPVNGDPEDDALWGRVRVIPFPNSYLGKEDKGKKERLKSDEVLTSILYWAVQGAMKWYSLGPSGLQTPDYVAKTTKAQRDAQDFVQQWLKECCAEDEEAWTPNETVMASYNKWCEANHVSAKRAKALAQSLQMKGYQTGVLRRFGTKVQKGVSGLKIPVSLWQVSGNQTNSVTDVTDVTDRNSNATDPLQQPIEPSEVPSVTAVTDVTGESVNFENPYHKADFPISPVTSVTEGQSVTFSQDTLQNHAPDVVAIPDDFTFEPEECTVCACGITRQLGDKSVCVRCYPPKGYSSYSHLVDEMYPRKIKVHFGQGGAI